MNKFVEQAVAFTEAYRKHSDAPPALREAMCLKAQYPAILAPLRPGDVLAGCRSGGEIVYAGTIRWFPYPGYSAARKIAGKQGGYCFDFSAMERYGHTDEDRCAIESLTSFWAAECGAGVLFAPDSPVRKASMEGNAVDGINIGFCMAMDFDRLVRRGIPGLRADVEARRARAVEAHDDTAFCDGLLVALEVLGDVCAWYARQARELAQGADDVGERRRLTAMADDLESLQHHDVGSFRQALQLVWLYNLVASAKHIEWPRLDVAFGDWFAHDLDQGVIDAEEAQRLLGGFWRLIHENGEAAVCRITVGGRGRRNAANADRFALAAMEATRRARLVTPQLTLRFHKDQDPALLDRAYEVVGEGCIYPMLYNDDVVIPGVMQSLHVDENTAEQYFPLGCGEYMLANVSPSLLDLNWNIPRALDAALRNGRAADGRVIGIETGEARGFKSFEDLYAAFLGQIKHSAWLGVAKYEDVCALFGGRNPFLFASLLTKDCLERNRALFEGGLRHVGGCLMGHGFTNAADSLAAIQREVFERKRITLEALVHALDCNFEGDPALWNRLLRAPKFGNDDPAADAVFTRMWRDIHQVVAGAHVGSSLDFLTASCVNPGGYYMGRDTGATADGRRAGEPFAIGNAPTAGRDQKGLTALCNSVAKVSPVNGGATTNFKLSREWFAPSPSKAKTVFGVYFASGGQHATLTVVNQDDLKSAREEPAKYAHVLVRLGGWSARFIDLERDVQDEIIRRTFYA